MVSGQGNSTTGETAVNYDEKFELAIDELTKMSEHSVNRVSYAEAKFLHSLLPEIIGVLRLGKQSDIDKLSNDEDIAAHQELIDLVNKIVGEVIDE
jgi:hypothetical protein